MAYTFNGTTQYLSANASPLGTGQLGDHTIAFWLNAVSGGGNTTIISISRSTETSGANNPAIFLQRASGGRLRCFYRENSSANSLGWADLAGAAIASTAFNSSWNHCVCRLSDAATAATVTSYVNGTQAETFTLGFAVPTTTGMNRLGIGAVVRGNVTSFCPGTVAEVGIWSTAITTDEIASLARGVSPSLVRPQSLVFYAPLVRNLVDVRGGLPINNNNSAAVADHPRIYT